MGQDLDDAGLEVPAGGRSGERADLFVHPPGGDRHAARRRSGLEPTGAVVAGADRRLWDPPVDFGGDRFADRFALGGSPYGSGRRRCNDRNVRVPFVVLSEIERSWRYWWFWPLQCLAVVAGVEGPPMVETRALGCPRGMGDNHWIIFSLSVGGEKADTVLRYGYGGPESGQIQALQLLAGDVRKDPDRRISIGVTRYHGESDITRAWGWLEFGLQ